MVTGTSITVVTASDIDILQNKDLTYSIESSSGSAYFDMDAQTGTIRVKAALDRELKALHTFTVKVEAISSLFYVFEMSKALPSLLSYSVVFVF